MIIDPIDLTVTYLSVQPELIDIADEIGADLVGHVLNTPGIEINISPNSRRVVRDKMDRWALVLNYYGPDKRSVANLAFTTREILLERMPATRLNGVTVSDVEENHAPHDFSDPVSNEQRYIHLVSLYCYK